MWTKFKGLFVPSPESQRAWRVFLRIESAVLFLAALAGWGASAAFRLIRS